MSRLDNGGPLFPTQELNADGTPATLTLGMSLRDYLAVKALQCVLTPSAYNMLPSESAASYMARRAYELADAMLKVRDK